MFLKQVTERGRLEQREKMHGVKRLWNDSIENCPDVLPRTSCGQPAIDASFTRFSTNYVFIPARFTDNPSRKVHKRANFKSF